MLYVPAAGGATRFEMAYVPVVLVVVLEITIGVVAVKVIVLLVRIVLVTLSRSTPRTL